MASSWDCVRAYTRRLTWKYASGATQRRCLEAPIAIQDTLGQSPGLFTLSYSTHMNHRTFVWQVRIVTSNTNLENDITNQVCMYRLPSTYVYVRPEGSPDCIFKTKNHNLGKFWRVLQWKMLIYFMAIWYICWFFGKHFPVLVYWKKKNLATLTGMNP
jgi:hypothetical protein